MSLRHIRGETRPQFLPVLTAQAVGLCDLLSLDTDGNVVRAQDVTWGTAVATPSAPTVAASAASRGTALTNALTGVKVSANFPWGEGALSAAGTATPTAAFGLKVTLAALPANALSWNVYVEDAAGSGTYKLQQVTTVSAGIIYVDSYGTGATPPSAVLTDATTVTQYAFAQAFVGVSGQVKTAAAARVLCNGADNIIRVDTSGLYLADVTSAAYEPGDYLGVKKATGNTLSTTNALAAVAHESLAVARAAQGTAGSSVTSLLVEVLSRKLPAARVA